MKTRRYLDKTVFYTDNGKFLAVSLIARDNMEEAVKTLKSLLSHEHDIPEERIYHEVYEKNFFTKS